MSTSEPQLKVREVIKYDLPPFETMSEEQMQVLNLPPPAEGFWAVIQSTSRMTFGWVAKFPDQGQGMFVWFWRTVSKWNSSLEVGGLILKGPEEGSVLGAPCNQIFPRWISGVDTVMPIEGHVAKRWAEYNGK